MPNQERYEFVKACGRLNAWNALSSLDEIWVVVQWSESLILLEKVQAEVISDDSLLIVDVLLVVTADVARKRCSESSCSEEGECGNGKPHFDKMKKNWGKLCDALLVVKEFAGDDFFQRRGLSPFYTPLDL